MIKLPSYLHRNQYGIYYFRITIPKSLQVNFGRKEIKRSLKIALRSEAVVASRIVAGQFFQLFEKVKASGSIPKSTIKTEIGASLISFGEGGSFKALNQDCGTLADNDNHLSSIKPQSDLSPRTESISLHELIDKYIFEKNREGSWTDNTHKEFTRIYKIILQIIGNKNVADINHSDARNLKEVLPKTPSNFNKGSRYSGKQLKEIIVKTHTGPLMAVRTINKYLNLISSLFGWAWRHGYTHENYFCQLALKENISV